MIRVLLSVVVLVAMSAPAEAAILFPRIRVMQLIWNTNGNGSACANGQCGAAAVKPMPLPAKPLPSATKPVKPMAPKPPMTNEQKREAFNKAVREGRYGEILVGNDFTPGGSDFDGPVDYIPVAPKPTPKVVK